MRIHTDIILSKSSQCDMVRKLNGEIFFKCCYRTYTGRNHTNALFVILVLQKKTDLKTHQHNHTREEQFQGNNCETHCIGDLSAYSKIILLLFLNLILVFYQFYVLVIYALVQRYFWKFVTELTQGEPISMHYM